MKLKKRFKFISIIMASALMAMGFISFLIQNDLKEEPKREREARSEIKEYLEYWTDFRSYPSKTFPKEGFTRAHEFTERLIQEYEDVQLPDPWESQGPRNQGGRTIALAVDPSNPNVVYAGAATGGLWRMTQTGTNYTWQYIETGHPVLGVNAIGVHPTNSNILYIGTGEVYQYGNSIGGLYIRSTRGSYGIGLLKSMDYGKTWFKSIDWAYNQERGVLAIKIHPTNPNIVYAGTTEGVFRTQDAGATWQHVLKVLMAVDIAINPSNPNIVFASCGNQSSTGVGLYRTTTGGAEGSWQKLSGGLPSTWGGKTLLSIFKASPNVIYADIANGSSTIGLYRSQNNGDTWTNLNSTDWAGYQGWFAHYVRAHPTDANRLLVAGINFYSSSNGGSSFQTVSGMHVDHHAFADHPTNPEIVYFGNDGGVYRSDNGGRTFSGKNSGYVTTQFHNGFSISATNPNHAAGGLQDNNCLRYTGSANWARLGCGGDGTFTAINPINDQVVYGASQNLNIRRSRDGGRTMTSITTGLEDGRTAFVAPFVIAPSQPNILYGGKTFLYKTTNEGTNWTKMNGGAVLSTNPIIGLGVSPVDANVVLASTPPSSSRRARVFASTNGGQTTTDITGSIPDRYYLDVVVSPHNKQVYFVTLSGFGSSHLYRSQNGGQSWQNIGAGLPDVPTSAFAEDPKYPGYYYVGNDIGVFASIDTGKTWLPYKVGMPTAALVMDLVVSLANRKIRAVTHGNGIYERPLIEPGNVSIKRKSPHLVGDFWNHPNPFQDQTQIEFIIEKAGPVSLSIVDVKGTVVRRLVADNMPTGKKSIQWNGENSKGSTAPAGRYYAVLMANGAKRSLAINKFDH